MQLSRPHACIGPSHRFLAHSTHPTFPTASHTTRHITSRCKTEHSTQQSCQQSTAPTDKWTQQLASLAAAAVCSLGLLVQPCAADELSIAFPASGNLEIREAQKTLVESWAYVDNLYVDSPNHTEWAKALQYALAATFKASNAGEVTQITRELLAKLDDPYTRLLQEEEETALAAEEEGKVQTATGFHNKFRIAGM